MAITKVLCVTQVDEGNPTAYLDHSLAYIQNPYKTDKCLLVGSINCQPETAFEQMVETKEIFGKRDKRQGYHIIIAMPKGEGTPEQVYAIGQKFCEEYFKGQYEVVFAVHTDKDHLHCHIVWNSVNMVTGEKYNCPKGEWKYHIQPLTNKLCQEYGLSIMPAEYSRNPVNMNRKQWEEEQNLKEAILRDAQFCASQAGSMEHFQYLMKRLGYDFKSKSYLMVRLPGCKLYHKLAELDDSFSENTFKYYLESMSRMIPKYYSKNFIYMRNYTMTPYQKQFYSKMYRLRIVEQKRFHVGSAYYAKDLKRFHQLQDEYLYLVRNDIKSAGDLIGNIENNQNRMSEISLLQKEIYKNRSVKKRACKSELDIREFQIWNMDAQLQLNSLKEEKQQLKQKNVMGQMCLSENLSTAICDVLETEEIRRDTELEVPEFIEVSKVTEEETNSKGVATSEKTDKEEKVETEFEVNDNPNLEQMSEELLRNEQVANEVTGAKQENAEMLIQDNENVIAAHPFISTVSYSEFHSMSDMKKASLLGVYGDVDLSEIMNKLQDFYREIDYMADYDELSKCAESIYSSVKSEEIRVAAAGIVQAIKEYGYDYSMLTTTEKARFISLKVDDPNFSLKLHSEVLKQLGIRMDIDEQMDDYQGIYERRLGEKSKEENVLIRGRG